MFLPISADFFFDLFAWGSFSHKGAPKRRFARERTRRFHKELGPGPFLKFSSHMPPDTDADFLKRHGLHMLAD